MAQMVEEMVSKNLATNKKLYDKAIAERNNFDSQHLALIEKERQYYLTAKKFQEECKHTEDLQAALSKYTKSKSSKKKAAKA